MWLINWFVMLQEILKEAVMVSVTIYGERFFSVKIATEFRQIFRQNEVR